MALNDVYELIDVQSMKGQEVLNTYFYVQRVDVFPVGITIAQALAEQWGSQIYPSLLHIQTNDVTHLEIKVRNLFSLSDIGSVTEGDNGDIGGGGSVDSYPTFGATAYQLAVPGRTTKAGQKRFAGVPESVVVDGVITDSTFLTDAATAGSKLSAPVTNGEFIPVDTWFPVVVKRVRSGVAGHYTYKLPTTLGATTLQQVSSAILNLLISSQVSRKIGRGA